MPERQRIEGFIFDLDGVLVATDRLHAAAWRRLAEEEGIPFDPATASQLRGLGRMASLDVVLQQAERFYTPAEREALADRKNAAYRGLLRELGPGDVLTGASALLDDLDRRRIKIAVASSSKNARLVLEFVGLGGRFETIVDGNDVSRSKPEPDLFLLAAERLGVRPHHCLVIEDAPSGIEAARRAGMTAVGIGDPAQLRGAAAVAPSLAHLNIDAVLTQNERSSS